jgi:hypothetical protein
MATYKNSLFCHKLCYETTDKIEFKKIVKVTKNCSYSSTRTYKIQILKFIVRKNDDNEIRFFSILMVK